MFEMIISVVLQLILTHRLRATLIFWNSPSPKYQINQNPAIEYKKRKYFPTLCIVNNPLICRFISYFCLSNVYSTIETLHRIGPQLGDLTPEF